MVYNAVLVFTIQQADLALQINILFHNLSHYGLSQDIEYSFLRYTVAFPYSSVGKESVCNAGDLGLIPGSGRSPGEGYGNPPKYSCLENPMDGGSWKVTVNWVTRVGHDWEIIKHANTQVPYSRTMLFVHFIYNSLHLLIPNPNISLSN